MRFPTAARTWLTLCLAIALNGCGAPDSTTASGGTGGTGSPADTFSSGQIQNFGSIYVNGIRFNIDSASITVDGNASATQADLAIGMVVDVTGTTNGADGTAATVTYADVIEGRVDQKVNGSALIAMGQMVEVDENTKYQNVIGIDDINAGDVLEISGFVKGSGLVAATYIKRKAMMMQVDYEVRGFASGHDPVAKTFTIGALTVNYAGTADIKGLPPNGSWNGFLLAVRGDRYEPMMKTMNATKVEAVSNPAADGNKAEIEGYVTAILGPDSFMIGAFSVRTDDKTRYKDGSAADVILGAYVEVEGSVVSSVIQAKEIEFKANARIEASVATVDAGAGTLTFAGLSGMTVVVNAFTDYNNAQSLADIATGNYVRVNGRALAATPDVVVATLVDRAAATPTSSPKVRGPLSVDPVDPLVTVLGVTADTSGWADNRFKDEMGNVIGRSGFFARARANDIVKLQGKAAGNVVTWDSIQFK